MRLPAQMPKPPPVEDSLQIVDAITERFPILVLVMALFIASIAVMFVWDWMQRRRQHWMDERDQRIREDERNAKR